MLNQASEASRLGNLPQVQCMGLFRCELQRGVQGISMEFAWVHRVSSSAIRLFLFERNTTQMGTSRQSFDKSLPPTWFFVRRMFKISLYEGFKPKPNLKHLNLNA